MHRKPAAGMLAAGSLLLPACQQSCRMHPLLYLSGPQGRGCHSGLVSTPQFRHQLGPVVPLPTCCRRSTSPCFCRRSGAAIRELVSTPQFRHQLDLFSHALMTGQLDTSQVGWRVMRCRAWFAFGPALGLGSRRPQSRWLLGYARSPQTYIKPAVQPASGRLWRAGLPALIDVPHTPTLAAWAAPRWLWRAGVPALNQHPHPPVHCCSLGCLRAALACSTSFAPSRPRQTRGRRQRASSSSRRRSSGRSLWQTASSCWHRNSRSLLFGCSRGSAAAAGAAGAAEAGGFGRRQMHQPRRNYRSAAATGFTVGTVACV